MRFKRPLEAQLGPRLAAVDGAERWRRLAQLGLDRSPFGWPFACFRRSGVAKLMEACRFARLLARLDPALPLALPGLGMAGPWIHRLSSAQQRRRWLRPLSERGGWGALAVSEAACGAELSRLRTTAERVGPEFLLSGNKSFVTNLPRARWALVIATLDPDAGPEAHRAFMVDVRRPGLQIVPRPPIPGLDLPWADLQLSSCRVPAEAQLGDAEFYARGGLAKLQPRLDPVGVLLGAVALGVADALWAQLRAEAHPAMAWAEARRRWRTAALLVEDAADRFDRGKDQFAQASMAKLGSMDAAKAALSLARDAAQLPAAQLDAADEQLNALAPIGGGRAIHLAGLAQRFANPPD